jgi:hypothetical protein
MKESPDHVVTCACGVGNMHVQLIYEFLHLEKRTVSHHHNLPSFYFCMLVLFWTIT